ncbi:unnamed protein product [Cuscuta europaea]|uniref:Uncharacterized protein n=1 Tax=Cuscuta europaea TaxID=41803 RepID=A0A9P0YZU8_CUSEU|nr:unnamed protein product [Cuscuta europaea]
MKTIAKICLFVTLLVAVGNLVCVLFLKRELVCLNWSRQNGNAKTSMIRSQDTCADISLGLLVLLHLEISYIHLITTIYNVLLNNKKQCPHTALVSSHLHYM